MISEGSCFSRAIVMLKISINTNPIIKEKGRHIAIKITAKSGKFIKLFPVLDLAKNRIALTLENIPFNKSLIELPLMENILLVFICLFFVYTQNYAIKFARAKVFRLTIVYFRLMAESSR